MAWRFHAIDATSFPRLRPLDGVEGLISTRCHAHAPHVLDLFSFGIPVRRVQLARHLRELADLRGASYSLEAVRMAHDLIS